MHYARRTIGNVIIENRTPRKMYVLRRFGLQENLENTPVLIITDECPDVTCEHESLHILAPAMQSDESEGLNNES